MEEYIPVADSNVNAQGAQADAAQSVDNSLSVASLYEAVQAESVAGEQVEIAPDIQSHDDGAQTAGATTQGQAYKTQADVDKAIGQRLAQERSRLEKGDEYQLGKFLLDSLTATGLSRSEAANKLKQAEIDRQAEVYAKDPKAFYKEQLLKSQTPSAPQAQDSVQALAQELAQAKLSGDLPESFGKADLTDGFVSDMKTYGVRPAIEMWKRQRGSTMPTAQAVAAEVERRHSAPAPMSPNGQSAQPTIPDFASMSSDDFRKYENAIKRAANEGKRVRF